MIIILLLVLIAIYAYSGTRSKADRPPLWRQNEVNKIISGSYVSSEKTENQYISSVNRQAVQRTAKIRQPVLEKTVSKQPVSKQPILQHIPEEAEQETTAYLGDIQDLMAKGYDGNMTFDRDFLGEAIDMINSYIY